MRPLFSFAGVLLIAAVIVGALLGNTELLNPSENRAKVAKLEAETEAIRERTAYEARKHEIELLREEERTRLALDAARKRQEIQEPLLIAGLVFASMLATSIVVPVAWYWIARARLLSTEHDGRLLGSGRQTEPAGTAGMPGRTPVHEQGLSSIDTRNLSPLCPSYDGLLAYVYDSYLRADGAMLFFVYGIAPHVADFYHRLLQRVHIVTERGSGQNHWAIRPGITSLEDVKMRISRQAFHQLIGLQTARAESGSRPRRCGKGLDGHDD